jgi:hypothetical protein
MRGRDGLLAALVTITTLAAGACGSGRSPAPATPSVASGSSAAQTVPAAARTSPGRSPSLPGRSLAGTICRATAVGAADPAGDSRAPLEAAFTPVTVVQCGVTFEYGSDGRVTATIAIEERTSSDVSALVAAMRLPDARERSRQGCLAYGDLDPEVWFLDAAGAAVLPRWPRDSCGHRSGMPSWNAWRSLRWTVTARVPVPQTP